MSDIRKPKWTRRQRKLQRAADGRLFAAGDKNKMPDNDIGNMWAQQERIRLAEAIEEEKKRLDRKNLRKKRGLVGVVSKDLSKYTGKVKKELFGEEAVKNQPMNKPSSGQGTAANPAKSVEININMPGLPKLHPIKAVKRSLGKVSKKALVISGSIVLALILAYTGQRLWTWHIDQLAARKAEQRAAAQASKGPVPGTPTFNTIVPSGQNVKWYRVSPPHHAPVYAFGDKVAGTPVDVSEQPLPQAFQYDTSGQIKKLAKSFGASQTFNTNNGTAVYYGTSNGGPQSLIMTENNLLILIKSTAIVTNSDWVNYVSSLQ